ncbi:MAG: hypothetical protein IBX39_08575, partial [Candidatus Methanoperedenaceae archaeon]|nr:hypothetical protein [Candidatus Methanoperedenaceae archaeon]
MICALQRRELQNTLLERESTYAAGIRVCDLQRRELQNTLLERESTYAA